MPRLEWEQPSFDQEATHVKIKAHLKRAGLGREMEPGTNLYRICLLNPPS